MKGLIIEENHLLRYILTEQLHELGVERVVECTNGLKALEYIKKFNHERLSVMFLDLEMEGMNGYTFLDELMYHSVFQDIPLFPMTENPHSLNLPDCFKHEIAGIINKPFDFQEIENCVKIAENIEINEPQLADTIC